MAANPFRIERSPLLSWVLGLRTYAPLYEWTQTLPATVPFAARALNALGINVECTAEELAAVPQAGPALVASNHPHGLLDGLALASAVMRVRPDVRILTNHLLSRVPELADLCFFVDPFGGSRAHARSQSGLRAAHLWLRRGGALIAFPSGEVAHRRDGAGGRTDSAWLPTAARLALGTAATVVPAFIGGTNSRLFYAAGRIHPLLRTLMLPRELLLKRHTTVSIRFGAPMSAGLGTLSTARIRAAVDDLRGGGDPIAADVARLPTAARLVESGAFQVFVASATQIPNLLHEIGRLREATYRAIGEGTGRHSDLDPFDARYLHLFCWDRSTRRVVGAYRIGQTDRLVAEHGVESLYTRTLFRYDQRLIARLSPALELGRSFIRAEYQKNYNALLLLWKGIGQFVSMHPQYRVLFGPVSISARYSDSSHHLLMAFLEQNHLDADLAALVAAVNPTPTAAPPAAVPDSIDDASRAIARMEADGKGMPVLLRQYLKLNARLLGFNVDPLFGDALDALMMVDLTAVDRGMLNRYFGRDEAASFLAFHQHRQAADAA